MKTRTESKTTTSKYRLRSGRRVAALAGVTDRLAVAAPEGATLRAAAVDLVAAAGVRALGRLTEVLAEPATEVSATHFVYTQ